MRQSPAAWISAGLVRRPLIGAAFAWDLYVDGNLMDARNAAFSGLVIAELMRSFGARSNLRTIREVGVLSNLRLFAVVIVSFGLQLVIHHLSLLEILFGIEPITLARCVWWIALGMLPLSALELRKLAIRRRATNLAAQNI